MNVIIHEWQVQKKAFFFWCLGVALLVMAGMTKYTGIAASKNIDINTIMDQFPRIVLAVLGILGLNANTLDGYYAMMAFYSLICACIYATFLGFDTVQREAMDKTQDFLFTKPVSRRRILIEKMIANIIFLFCFCSINLLSSIASVQMLSLKQNILLTIIDFNVTIFSISIVFYFASSFLSLVRKDALKGSSLGMYAFLITFLIGIVSQMTTKLDFLRILAPMRYFLPTELLKHQISVPYLILNLLLILIFGLGTFYLFEKKDMQAS